MNQMQQHASTSSTFQISPHKSTQSLTSNLQSIRPNSSQGHSISMSNSVSPPMAQQQLDNIQQMPPGSPKHLSPRLSSPRSSISYLESSSIHSPSHLTGLHFNSVNPQLLQQMLQQQIDQQMPQGGDIDVSSRPLPTDKPQMIVNTTPHSVPSVQSRDATNSFSPQVMQQMLQQQIDNMWQMQLTSSSQVSPHGSVFNMHSVQPNHSVDENSNSISPQMMQQMLQEQLDKMRQTNASRHTLVQSVHSPGPNHTNMDHQMGDLTIPEQTTNMRQISPASPPQLSPHSLPPNDSDYGYI
eukprot:CAMPEP_0196593412 /NCGR_PEP_ID=MMETSP1081-20130531/75552_1 /TAXON_ID=36882 /ORGANISM="Pyramimonas amylifera, Strain CCMP720" /LENGTH=296 /DNA_ID=CAMNT_0041917387 /DNA_START=97 /DNA_END=987 /DNA_ORIENTATION=+